MPEIAMSDLIAPVSLAEETANRIQMFMESMDRVGGTDDIIEMNGSSDEDSSNVDIANAKTVQESTEVCKSRPDSSLTRQNSDVQENKPNKDRVHEEKYVERKKRLKKDRHNMRIESSASLDDGRQNNCYSSASNDSPRLRLRSGKRRLKSSLSKEMLENLSQEQCEKLTSEVIDCYDARVYHPIRASQQDDEVDVPIMSPPPLESEPKYNFNEFRANFCRTLAVQFLEGKDIKACTFASKQSEQLLDSLAFPTNNAGKDMCKCANQSIFDDSVSGWETPPKLSKSKSGKRRKHHRVSSETAFSRLTGQMILDREDTFNFQHYNDSKQYIEHYRFVNTVGDVCQRPATSQSNSSRRLSMENEAYYSKLRSAFCAMASSFDLRTMLQDRDNASSSSSDRNCKKSDDESVEDPNSDKTLSMKDRGKTLNLAPVRECSVPDLLQADNFDQYQQNYATINQYLNLMTPPLPEQCLQLAYDAAKARRNGNRIPITGDYLFPVSNQRRGVTPLRLGSAEFVKPGTPEQFAPPESRWSSERKASLQRSSTFHGRDSTVPGMLYVGSTVTPSPIQQGRIKSGGKPTSYHVTQPHPRHLQQQSKDAPHQIYGQKFKPCERVTELHKDRARGREEKVVPQYRTGVETRNNYDKKKDRLISVNVNHLGIRGRTFKAEELSVFYQFHKDKNRRVATLTGNT